MLSLKGETDAPIPATSSSHTSEAPRCAMWCSVPLSSSYGRRACPCHGSAGGGPERRPAGFLPGNLTHGDRERFFLGGVLCPRLPLSRAMASTDRSTGARELSCLLSTNRAMCFMWRTQCVLETHNNTITAMFGISLGLKWPKHADVRRI